MASVGKQDLITFLTTAPTKSTPAPYESAAEAKRAIDNTIDAMKSVIAKKESTGLTIVGLGTFKRVKRAAREGRNPSTGETIKIKASKTVSFKVSKAFKETLK